jgi:hypothetical protein
MAQTATLQQQQQQVLVSRLPQVMPSSFSVRGQGDWKHRRGGAQEADA